MLLRIIRIISLTMTDDTITMNQLRADETAIITGFIAGNVSLETRLREIGFAEGDYVRIKHKGLFGGNPISVSLNGALIALRKHDAASVLVRRSESQS